LLNQTAMGSRVAGTFEIEVIQDWTHLQRSVSFKALGADDGSQGFYAASGELAPTEPVRFPSVSILLLALLLSLLLHLLLLLLGKPNLSPSFFTAPAQQKHSIHLVLSPALVRHPNVIGASLLEAVLPSPLEPLLAPAPSVSTASNPAPLRLPQKRIIESQPAAASATSITAIRIQSLERDDLVAITAAQGGEGATASTIFDPRLREKLRQQQAVRSAVSEPAAQTWMDVSGSTWIKLPSGNCMSSPEAKAGAVKNWYLRACGGKSSSEEMIENMERDFHSRH